MNGAEHNKHCKLVLGKTCSFVNRQMDEPVKILAGHHRKLNHDLAFVKKMAELGTDAGLAAILHLLADSDKNYSRKVRKAWNLNKACERIIGERK